MIRSVKKEDLVQLARLDDICFPLSWSLEDFEKDFEDNPFFRGMVVEEDARILAYATYWITFEKGQLVRIGVDPDHRHQGLGAHLLEECLEKAAREGCELFSLDVRKSNQDALSLYKHAGFVVLHEAAKYYPDGEDAYVMAKGI